MRTARRTMLGRSGTASMLRWLCPATSRYMLYAALLLVGYLLGTALRPPWRSNFGSLATSDLDSSSSMGTAGVTSGHGFRLRHISASLSTTTDTSAATGTSSHGLSHPRRVAASVSTSAYSTSQASSGPAAAASEDEAALEVRLAPANRTLRFQVCNGFANQRLSIMYGMLLARRLGRSAVLPVLIDNGLQRSDATVVASVHNQVPFSSMYDTAHFIRSMRWAGIRVMVSEQERQQLQEYERKLQQQQQQPVNRQVSEQQQQQYSPQPLHYEVAPPESSYTQVGLAQYGWSAAGPLATQYGTVPHLAVDCALFKMMGYELSEGDVDLIWAGLEGLRPNAEASALIDRIVAAIELAGQRAAAEQAAAAAAGNSSSVANSSSNNTSTSANSASVPSSGDSGSGSAGSGGGSSFSFLHLRIENDWVEHCKRWESLRDGIPRDNCYRHTEAIGARLALFGVPGGPRSPLYVASYWPDTDRQRREQALSQLSAAGYVLVTSDHVELHGAEGREGGGANSTTGSSSSSPGPGSSSGSGSGSGSSGSGAVSRGREFAAMVEYFVGMRAERFMGNSVSTFAALGLLERRHAGRWAAYYNGGNIPMTALLPQLHRLPWVFTYNSWGGGGYDYMLKAAVRSALATHSLVPYCIFGGNTSSPIAAWLTRHDVTLISHSPEWRDELLAKAKAKFRENVHHSHLFKSPDMLVSTFQRVDLPVVPGLQQYSYVLYTDADVYFRRPVRLDDFGLPLPNTISMSYEFTDVFPYNAGVFLANLPAMRAHYPAFLRMMLDNQEGLYYTNYGPADQGILNKYYEADLKAHVLPQRFNAKPYHAADPAAAIVHFHGPKPHELLAFLMQGAKCDFFTICETAFLSGLCSYTREWAAWLPEEVTAVRLEDACAWLDSPGVVELFKKKWGLATQSQLSVSSPPMPVSAAAASSSSSSGSSSAGEEAARVERMRKALALQHPEHEEAAAAAEEEEEEGKGGKEEGAGKGEQQGAKTPPLATATSTPAAIDPNTRTESNSSSGSSNSDSSSSSTSTSTAQQEKAGTEEEEAAKQGAPKAEGVPLKDFDRVTAVSVDEKALEEAWGGSGAAAARRRV